MERQATGSRHALPNGQRLLPTQTRLSLSPADPQVSREGWRSVHVGGIRCVAGSVRRATRCRDDQHRIPLRGSEPALLQAMRAYIWKRRFRRRRTWLAWTVLLVADGLLVATDDFGFLTGAAAAATVLLATMMLGIGWARWAANIKRWRKLIVADAEVIVEDAALSIASNISIFTTPWSQFTEVWILPRCWMLFVVPDQSQIAPLADRSSEMATFLKQRLAGAIFKVHL